MAPGLLLALALGCCAAAPGAGAGNAGPPAAWEHTLDHGSVKGFPSFKEATELLDGWVQRFPELLQRRRIGESYQDLPIHAYVLAARTKGLEDRPQVLLTSLMHAREPAGLTVLVYFLGHLLDLYAAGDAEAAYVLAAREIWLVPFVNPDGYIANEGPGTKMFRKNRRPTCRDARDGGGSSLDSGVDLNRNFGVHWKSEFPPCNEEFQGARPFSEPETRAIRRVCEENAFRAAMNFHAFGGMLTHPYNWARRPRLPPDDQRIYVEVAGVFGWPRVGPAVRTVGYTASGESDDWMYGERGIISMSPEVGPESGTFWPPRSEIAGISRRNFGRILYVVRKAGLELSAAWAQRAVAPEGLPERAALLPGGAPHTVIELKLVNGGLSASAGTALGVAVAGAAVAFSHVGAGEAAGLLLLESGEARPLAFAPGPDGDLALHLRLAPLPRRSAVSLRLLMGRALEPAGPRRLRLCAAELPGDGSRPPGGPGGRTLCHCSGPTPLPAPGGGRNSGGRRARLVFASTEQDPPGAGEDGDAALCRAAAATATAGLPIESTVSVAVSPEHLAATLGGEGEGGGAAAPLALFSLGALAAVLGGCLAWQALVGRQPLTAPLHRSLELA